MKQPKQKIKGIEVEKIVTNYLYPEMLAGFAVIPIILLVMSFFVGFVAKDIYGYYLRGVAIGSIITLIIIHWMSREVTWRIK